MSDVEHAAGLELARKLCTVEDQRDELLAALKRSLNWLSSYPGGGASGAYDEARAAIAKAESQS